MSKEEKPSYYGILPAKVRYDKRLKPATKVMFSEITALSNKKGFCTAQNKYFAKLYGVNSATISRWISQLKKYNYIKVDVSQKTGNFRKMYPLIDIYGGEYEGGIDKKIKSHDKKIKRGYSQNNQDPLDLFVYRQKDQDINNINNKDINNTSGNNKRERVEKETISEQQTSSPSLSSSHQTFLSSVNGKTWIRYFEEEVQRLTTRQKESIMTITEHALFEKACQKWSDDGYSGRKVGKLKEVMREIHAKDKDAAAREVQRLTGCPNGNGPGKSHGRRGKQSMADAVANMRVYSQGHPQPFDADFTEVDRRLAAIGGGVR